MRRPHVQQTAAIFSNSYLDEYEYRRVHLSLLVLSNHYAYDIKVKQYSVVRRTDCFKSQTSTVALNPMFLVARTNTKLKKSRHYSNHLSLIYFQENLLHQQALLLTTKKPVRSLSVGKIQPFFTSVIAIYIKMA